MSPLETMMYIHKFMTKNFIYCEDDDYISDNYILENGIKYYKKHFVTSMTLFVSFCF
mgnify:CR=1 FL=1